VEITDTPGWIQGVETCAVADEVYGPRRPLMKISKKIALQLPKQDFYSIKLCTADNVEALLVSGRRGLLAHIRHCEHSAHTMYGLAQKKITALSNLSSLPALAIAACA